MDDVHHQVEKETQPENVRCHNAKVEKSSFTEDILNLAIGFVVNGQYSEELTADQRRSVRRRLKSIFIESGEVKLRSHLYEALRIRILGNFPTQQSGN